MKDKTIKNIAFSKNTPSAFLVMSPFQLLCAIEAIREFCISEYRIVFVCYESFEKRNNQMKLMAEDLGLEFDYYSLGHFSFDTLAPDIENDRKYSRIFIGDYYVTCLMELSVKYADKKAVLVYMDDGNSSISLLQGIRRDNRPSRWIDFLQWYRNDFIKKEKWREELCHRLEDRGILCSNFFYTIYSDIKSSKFVLYPNKFIGFVTQFCEENKENGIIYIVGPAIEAYAEQNRIREVDIESILWNKLAELRVMYENKKIVYIPHGRDANENVVGFCKMLNIEYRRINETIEYYMAKYCVQPYAVYGINSTALLNIKKMYPETTIVNWFLNKKYDNSFYPFFKSVANYYNKNNIIIDIIKYPSPTFKERVKIVCVNVYGLLCLVFRKLGLRDC